LRAQTIGRFNASEHLIFLDFGFFFSFFLQELKQLLNATLGIGSHRIEPRHRGDSVLRVQFRSKDEMDVARDFLHEQIYMGCRLRAVVSGKCITVAVVVLFNM
jgi:hypothetical protein